MRALRMLAVGAIAAALTVLAGRWGQDLFTVSEFVHFSVNFPTVPEAEVVEVADLGGPWSLLPADEWDGYPAGGLLVWGLEGKLTVDLGRRSWIKRLVQPDTLVLSSHWLRNVGTEPTRIRLALELCGMPVEWVTFERDWDERSQSTDRAIPAGGTFNMDWIVRLPAERRGRPVICRGSLSIEDAESGAILTRFPIEIVDSRARRRTATEPE